MAFTSFSSFSTAHSAFNALPLTDHFNPLPLHGFQLPSTTFVNPLPLHDLHGSLLPISRRQLPCVLSMCTPPPKKSTVKYFSFGEPIDKNARADKIRNIPHGRTRLSVEKWLKQFFAAYQASEDADHARELYAAALSEARKAKPRTFERQVLRDKAHDLRMDFKKYRAKSESALKKAQNFELEALAMAEKNLINLDLNLFLD